MKNAGEGNVRPGASSPGESGGAQSAGSGSGAGRERAPRADSWTARRESGVRAPSNERLRPLRRVRKRDGRDVPFDRNKIRSAIAGAMAAVGDDDPQFAAEVAGVVELALRDRAAQSGASYVPTIEDIQDFVERALMDLGRAAVAKAYILYRDRRARLRDALRVHERTRGPLRVRESEGVQAWSKGRIVAALLNEAELSRGQAEDVASAVERRVFASGWKRISTGLVRELVASELFERGWTHALHRQEAIGMARSDLRALFEGRALHPWERLSNDGPDGGELADRGADAGGELLRRFAQEELFPEALAELHREGDVHLADLARCDRPLCLSVEAELLARGGDSRAWSLIERVAELAPRVARLLVLEQPEVVLASLDGKELERWLAALRSVARAAGVRVDLSFHDAERVPSASLMEALVRPLGAGEAAWAPRLYVAGRVLEAFCAREPERVGLLEELFAAGRLWTSWGEAEERFVAPGCHRLADERGALACSGALALNLPRLARRAGARREDLFQAGLTELVRAALAVAGAWNTLHERAHAARSLGLHTRRSLALVPVGLREALFVLGDGSLDPDQAARTLGLCAEAADRFGSEDATAIVLTPFFGEDAARRFAWLDARRATDEGGRQNWLFDAEATASAVDPAGLDALELRGAAQAYGSGFALGVPAVSAAGRAEAEALRTLRAGAYRPVPAHLARPTAYGESAPAGLSGSAEGEGPHLAAWKRFELMRRSHAGEIELELFPVPRRAEARSSRPAPLRPLP